MASKRAARKAEWDKVKADKGSTGSAKLAGSTAVIGGEKSSSRWSSSTAAAYPPDFNSFEKCRGPCNAAATQNAVPCGALCVQADSLRILLLPSDSSRLLCLCNSPFSLEEKK